MLDGREMLYVDQVDVDRAVQLRDWTGVRIPAHAVPSGLVALATQSEDARDEYLGGPLDDVGVRTMTDPAALRRRIRAIARRGTEWAVGEYLDDVNSVAAAVLGPDGRLAAVVHVHGPSYRFPKAGEADHVAGLVGATAARIAARLGGRPAVRARLTCSARIPLIDGADVARLLPYADLVDELAAGHRAGAPVSRRVVFGPDGARRVVPRPAGVAARRGARREAGDGLPRQPRRGTAVGAGAVRPVRRCRRLTGGAASTAPS